MNIADEALADTPPRANPDLLGQEAAEHALLSAWRSGRMPHAWLIGGARGIGKATLAYRFARFVLRGGAADGFFGEPDSLAIPASDPVFRRVAAGGHADLFTLESGMIHPETNRPTKEIVVPHVRRAIEFLLKTASEGGWRVLIVDEAELMNRSAANALLKLLEEPPPSCLIFLVSHSPGRLLPTIRSRCRSLNLPPLSPRLLVQLLARYRPELDPSERDVLIRLCDGSIGRALDLADHGGVELYETLAELLGRLPALDMQAVHGFAEQLARAGDDAVAGFRTAVDLLSVWVAQRIRATAGLGPDDSAPGAFPHLQPTGRPERWFEVWANLRRLAGATEGLNLDRKQALLGMLLDMQAAAAD